MTAFTTAAALRWLLVLVFPMVTNGFMTQARRNAFVSSRSAAKEHGVPTKLFEVLTESGFEHKMPSNPDAERIGIREWPKQVRFVSKKSLLLFTMLYD